MVATSSRFWGWFLVMGAAIGYAIAFSGDCASAQITPDGTLGAESSVVTPKDSVDVISGGATRGATLFHSFEQFSVPTHGAAHFNNAVNIQNIISRVTGGSVSNINGLIQANGTANLFLLNPNGIIFGPNAELNIGGSFLASTASAVNLADGTQFSATTPQTTPLLTVSVPVGLQYGGTIGNILNQSQATNSNDEVVGLQVQPGKTLTLVGGDVSLDGGNLLAPGGRVELGGVAGEGTVGLFVDSNNLGLRFPDGVALADVSLTNGAGVDVTAGGEGSIAINAQNLDVLGGSFLYAGIGSGLSSVDSQTGDITLNATEAIGLNDSVIDNSVLSGAVGNGGDIKVTAGSLSVMDGAQLAASTRGQGDAGSVTINARDTVSFDGEDSDGYNSGAYSNVDEDAVGKGGGVNITTGSLFVTNGAQLAASTRGQGDAGSVTINASDTVSFDGEDSDGNSSGAFSTVRSEAVGNGGNINIMVGSLSVTDGASISAITYDQGKTGSVTVTASDSVEVIGFPSTLNIAVAPGAKGNGGDMSITTGRLTILDGGQVATGTFGLGNAGNLTVNASDLVEASGRASVVQPNGSFYPGGLFAQVGRTAGGDGGDLRITTGRLIISGGAVVSARSFGTVGKANAGNITVTAFDSVKIVGTSIDGRNPSALAASAGPELSTDMVTGDGGDVKVETKRLIISDGAVLSSRNVGQGRAGNLEVVSSSILLDKGEIRAETALGNGGDIILWNVDLLQMHRDSKITASAGGNAQVGGDGGNITINAQFIVSAASQNSDITANAFTGKGGRVNINATGIFGLVPRSRQELERLLNKNQPAELNPARLPTNDITAISQSNPSLSGQVTINTPDVDPAQGLVNLPAIPIDTEVVQACQPGGSQQQSQFIITGRGGLPPNPADALSTDAVQVDLVTLNREVEQPSTPAASISPTSPAPAWIVEATGWVMDALGNVVLIANAPTVISKSQVASCKSQVWQP